MRHRPLLLAAALLAGTVVPLTAPAAADTGPVPLGTSRLGQLLVDEANARVFVSPGPGGSGVQVTDLSGSSVATVDGLPHANGMALTADGRSLWVAAPSAGLVRLSTTTLTVEQRISLPTGHCAGDVAVSGSRLVYGHSCTRYLGSGGYGGVGVVDAATGTSYGNYTSGPFYKPVVAAGPNGQVYAGDAALSPTGLHLLDVSGPVPVPVAARASVCANLRDLSASPDGSQVVLACGSPYEHTAYSADKLEVLTRYPTGAYPVAGAWSGDGRVFAAGTDAAHGTDVSVHAASSATPGWVRDFGSSTALLQPRGLALSADGTRAWAVTRGSTGGLDLRVLDAPAPSASSLTLASDPPSFFVGEETFLGGWLSSDGVGVGGVPLTVTREATGTAPVTLPTVTTSGNGSYAFRESPTEAGSYTYAVAWAGDATHRPVSAVETVTVHPLGRSLELWIEPPWDAPSEVDGRLLLRSSDTDVPGATTVRLTRQLAGTTTTLPPVTTDGWGGAGFRDVPPAGTYLYTAAVDAVGTYPALTATATITVPASTTPTPTPTPAPTPTATVLALDVPGTTFVGSPVKVSGTLTSSAGPVSGATVSVVRTGCSTGSWSATAVTTPDGAWDVTDADPPIGTCTYTASYAGDGTYAKTSTSAKTTVTVRPTTLSVASPSTALAGSAVTLRGALTAGTGPMAGALVRADRSGCSDWSGTATTAVDGSWVLSDPSVPAGTCTWSVSYGGSATHAPSSASATTVVTLRASSIFLSVVPGTGKTKKQVLVTAQLTGGSSNRTVRLTAQPVGGTEVVLADEPVDSTGKLTVAYTPRSTTAYRATYSGDALWAPTSAERLQ